MSLKRNDFKDRFYGQDVMRIVRDRTEKGLGFPVIEDRTSWQQLEPELKRQLISSGQRAKQTPFPQLLLSDYREFSRNGNRVHFENKFFQRRLLLTRMILAECVEDQGNFLDPILDGLWLLLEETTWCLPAHNTCIRDTAPDQIPDPQKPVIDLFAGETAAILGMAEYLLRPKLAEISAVFTDRVNRQIRERVLVPYLTWPFWWKGDGVQQLMNWTPWITQNVLAALFSRPSDFWQEGEKEQVLEQAVRSLDYYLDTYGEDGCCDEGAQYYGHAGLSLFGCMDLLERITGHEPESAGIMGNTEPASSGSVYPGVGASFIQDLWHSTLIRNIASYIVKIYVGNGYYLNFADCSPFPGRRTARDFLFGLKTGEAALAAFAAEDYRKQSWEERLMEGEESLYIHLLQIFSHQDMMTYLRADAGGSSAGLADYPAAVKAAGSAENRRSGTGVKPVEVCGTAENRNSGTGVKPVEAYETAEDEALRCEDAWFASTGLLVVRDRHFVLAAKAGDNADNHNHNDVGSVILYKDGQPFLIDLGVETYTARTFSEHRYEIWTMQSAYHNVPTFFDGAQEIQQQDGEAFRASGVQVETGEEKASLSMELASAYPDPRIRSYHRRVTLWKGSRVEIEDAYHGSLSCALTLMTYEKPVIEKDRIRVGDLGAIRTEGAGRITAEECQIRDPRLSIAWKHSCYRLRLYFTAGQEILRCVIE